MTEKSSGDSVRNISDQLGALVRDEVRTALEELRAKARQAGMGGALLALAGVLALYAGGAFVAALASWLSRTLPRWKASAVTGLVLSAAAAVAGVLGVERLRTAAPPLPEQALADAESEVRAATEAARHRPERPST